MRWPRVAMLAHGVVNRLRAPLIALAAMGTLFLPAGVFADLPTRATVQFGNPNSPSTDQNCNRGSATVAPDPCASAFHRLIPSAVAISPGGTVDFVRNGFHQVAVYAPGKLPNAIMVTGAAEGRVNDPNGRLFLSAPGNGGTVTVSTFTQPGRYLVICNLLTHWDQNMWGWVEVQ